MDSNETDTQSNQTPLLSSLRSSTPNSGEYRSTNTELLTRQEQSAQSAYSEQNQSHSTESADNDPLPSSPSNEIYLSAENDFRRDSVRSTSVIDDSGMHTGRNIKRNGTLPSLSKDALSLGHHGPFLQNYLQVPQSLRCGRSSSSIGSMQSDLESCMGDTNFPNDFIESKVIGYRKVKLTSLNFHSFAGKF